MTIYRTSVVVVSLLVGSCGSTTQPVQPSSEFPPLAIRSHLNLQLGQQLLTIVGVNFSNDPEIPVCVPLGSPPSGTFVNTLVMVTHEGADWVARSVSSDAGNIEMRFRETEAKVTGVAVKGTIGGSGGDTAFHESYVPNESRVTLTANAGTGVATVEGSGDPHYSYVGGRLSGLIAYSDRAGRTGLCSVVLWAFLPARPGSIPVPATGLE